MTHIIYIRIARKKTKNNWGRQEDIELELHSYTQSFTWSSTTSHTPSQARITNGCCGPNNVRVVCGWADTYAFKPWSPKLLETANIPRTRSRTTKPPIEVIRATSSSSPALWSCIGTSVECTERVDSKIIQPLWVGFPSFRHREQHDCLQYSPYTSMMRFLLCEGSKTQRWSQHLILHTHISLAKVLRAAGFKKIKIIHCQRYNFNNHIGWFLKNKPGGHRLFKNFSNQSILEEYRSFLIRIKKTDTLIDVASY